MLLKQFDQATYEAERIGIMFSRDIDPAVSVPDKVRKDAYPPVCWQLEFSRFSRLVWDETGNHDIL